MEKTSSNKSMVMLVIGKFDVTSRETAINELFIGHRKNLTAWANGDDLVLAVAAQNNNTIVVGHSVGPLIVEPWIDHPNVTAVCFFFHPASNHVLSSFILRSQVVWAGLPGQESGNSLADVLYGDWNPSGRLPYTIAKRLEDYPAQITSGGGPFDVISIPYSEGLFIDYRHFDAVSPQCATKISLY